MRQLDGPLRYLVLVLITLLQAFLSLEWTTFLKDLIKALGRTIDEKD